MAFQDGGLGWMPDPPKAAGQPEDWDANTWLGEDPIPEPTSNRDLILSVLSQGSAPSCVAHAGTQIIRADHVRQGHLDAPLASRMWGWLFSRAMHGAMEQWSGTYLRSFFEALNRMGFPAEKWWPYLFDEVSGKERWKAMPAGNAFRMAHDQKAPVEYRRIREAGYERVDAVKRALGRRKCVAFGTQVSREFCRGAYSDNYVADPPGPHDEIAGGHAMVLADFEPGDQFLGPNSWGDDWWLDGWFRMSADYIASPLSRDFWIVEHAPIFSELEV